jgi:hypothetical protein
MEDQLLELVQSPDNWSLRCSIAQSYYENGNVSGAASLIKGAPSIPQDEDSILFAATILGAESPASGLALIDGFTAANKSTKALAALHATLGGVPATASGSTPLAPRKIRPPGAEEDADELSSAAPGSAIPIAALVAEGEEILGVEEYVESTGERSFIVGEGEAVHAAEKPPETKDKLGAVAIALIVHVVVGILLGIWAVSSPPPAPPQISVSSVSNADSSSLENKTLTKQKQKSAATVSSAQPVVAAEAFSNFAVPDTFDATSNLSMVAMSDSDAGFGMSMSGFGDVSNMGAIPAAMQSRCSMSQRMKRLRESGGEDRAEKAVREGLEFLSKQQTKEGENAGAFGKEFTVAMTGLTLLAYLGHCETPESPKFGDSVVSAALFLMDRCLKSDKGLMTNGKSGNHVSYEHAIGTYALCELYTMTKESGKEIPRLESVLRKAVGVIVDGQNKSGGWAYGYNLKGVDDMSVAGWQIQALKAAHNTGRSFAGVDKALDQATTKYLPAIQDSEGAFKYRPDDARGKSSLTGAALLAMQIWKGADSATFDKGFKYLTNATANPAPGADYYAPYYNTQMFFLAEGPEWENYNKKFQPKLLDAQNDDGSWTKDSGGAERADNQIKNTCWAVLMLEVYYRYLPTTEKVKGLGAR